MHRPGRRDIFLIKNSLSNLESESKQCRLNVVSCLVSLSASPLPTFNILGIFQFFWEAESCFLSRRMASEPRHTWFFLDPFTFMCHLLSTNMVSAEVCKRLFLHFSKSKSSATNDGPASIGTHHVPATPTTALLHVFSKFLSDYFHQLS